MGKERQRENLSPSSRGRGLKCSAPYNHEPPQSVALFTRAWIEMAFDTRSCTFTIASPSSRGRGLKWSCRTLLHNVTMSPSSRGRGLKSADKQGIPQKSRSPSSRGRGLKFVSGKLTNFRIKVALFTRAWIEMALKPLVIMFAPVALFTRAWIEIASSVSGKPHSKCRPLHEGVD